MKEGTSDDYPVKLVTLDPGHFHAALLQKVMYPQVSPLVHVYAPGGAEVDDHVKKIEGFNTRRDNPTQWQQRIHTGSDFLERTLSDGNGNVAVVAGNNLRKTRYIKDLIDTRLHVLSDKPMCIDQTAWQLLKSAFESARDHGVLLYDIMTERFEITTILQRELVNDETVFGELQTGSPSDPAVVKDSVHHLFKEVAGKPLQRAGWYFDIEQQGEGIVDVATHLVDIVMWVCFPEEIIDYATDVQIHSARHWPTRMTQTQFNKVTGLSDFPDFLAARLDSEGVLPYYCNGEIQYALRDVHSRISVVWDFEAPPGCGDTHFSVIKGSKSHVLIKQGEEQNYQPEVFLEPARGVDSDVLAKQLRTSVERLEARSYPGLGLEPAPNGWHLLVPDLYRVGHEAHFGEVTKKFLSYLDQGGLPEWEVPNMIAKYYTTTRALEIARKADG